MIISYHLNIIIICNFYHDCLYDNRFDNLLTMIFFHNVFLPIIFFTVIISTIIISQVYISGLSEFRVQTEEDVMQLLEVRTFYSVLTHLVSFKVVNSLFYFLFFSFSITNFFILLYFFEF